MNLSVLYSVANKRLGELNTSLRACRLSPINLNRQIHTYCKMSSNIVFGDYEYEYLDTDLSEMYTANKQNN